MPSLSKAAVLIVEDNPNTRAMYRAMVTDAVLTVITGADGYDALRLIDSCHIPDVILLDLVLPRLGGRDVHRADELIGAVRKCLTHARLV